MKVWGLLVCYTVKKLSNKPIPRSYQLIYYTYIDLKRDDVDDARCHTILCGTAVATAQNMGCIIGVPPIWWRPSTVVVETS